MKRKLVAVIFLCSIGNAHAMEQQQAMLERVMVLAEAATRAAIAAEKATTQTVHTAANLASSSSSSVSDGLQAASRILKNLEDAMTFASWRFQFMSWLTYGDSRCIQVLQAKEATEATPTMADYNEAQKEMSHKLYAVLTSYLRGRCAHLAEAHAKARDGFAVWYSLMREFEQSSRQRSLALAQALASYPTFSKDRSCMDSSLIFEETIQRFEESSNTKYPDNSKLLFFSGAPLQSSENTFSLPWMRKQPTFRSKSRSSASSVCQRAGVMKQLRNLSMMPTRALPMGQLLRKRQGQGEER